MNQFSPLGNELVDPRPVEAQGLPSSAGESRVGRGTQGGEEQPALPRSRSWGWGGVATCQVSPERCQQGHPPAVPEGNYSFPLRGTPRYKAPSQRQLLPPTNRAHVSPCSSLLLDLSVNVLSVLHIGVVVCQGCHNKVPQLRWLN